VKEDREEIRYFRSVLAPSILIKLPGHGTPSRACNIVRAAAANVLLKGEDPNTIVIVDWPSRPSHIAWAAPACVLARAPIADLVAEHDAIERAVAKWADADKIWVWLPDGYGADVRYDVVVRDWVRRRLLGEGPFLRVCGYPLPSRRHHPAAP